MLAVVDVVHTANLGYGRKLGLGFVRSGSTAGVTDVVAEKGKAADIKIRNLGGGRFEVTDPAGKRSCTEAWRHGRRSLGGSARGRAAGVQTNAASPVATRR